MIERIEKIEERLSDINYVLEFQKQLNISTEKSATAVTESLKDTTEFAKIIIKKLEDIEYRIKILEGI